jgi:hypothetical protein
MVTESAGYGYGYGYGVGDGTPTVVDVTYTVALSTYETLSNIQSEWPLNAAYQATGVDHTRGYIQGILVWEHGSGFSAPDEAECTYFNKKVAAGKEGSIPDTAVCGSRAACEDACAAVDCAAFSFEPGSYVCNLYSACPLVDRVSSTVVKLDRSATCTIDVQNAVTPLEAGCVYDYDDFSITNCDLNGEYVKVSSTEYVAASNLARIVVDDTQPCLGWALEQNTGTAYTKTLYTYKNAPASILEEYELKFREALAAAPKADGGGQRWTRIRKNQGWLKGKPFPAECDKLCPTVGSCPLDATDDWEVPTGWNCDNEVLKLLCVEQCDPPTETVMAASLSPTMTSTPLSWTPMPLRWRSSTRHWCREESTAADSVRIAKGARRVRTTPLSLFSVRKPARRGSSIPGTRVLRSNCSTAAPSSRFSGRSLTAR